MNACNAGTTKARLDHIGIVVDDIADTRAFLETLGFELVRSGSMLQPALEAAFLKRSPQDVQIELIAFSDPDLRQEKLAGSRGRLDHIALEFDDVFQARNRLAGAGVKTQRETPLIVGKMRCFFTQPETSFGVVYQLLDYKGR